MNNIIIIAIGGGELKRFKTLIIDKEIVKLTRKITRKKNPKALLIPTASNDSENYLKAFEKVYGGKLNCKPDVLYLIKQKLTKQEIKKKILDSDLIYVGGGDTDKMLKIWKKFGVDKILKIAAKRNIILSGLSAGSYCWFEKSLSSSEEKIYYGLGLIKNLSNVCHYPKRGQKKKIWKNFRKVKMSTIALEDCSAIEIINNKYRILTSSKRARAFKLSLVNSKEIEERLPIDKKFRSLKELKK